MKRKAGSETGRSQISVTGSSGASLHTKAMIIDRRWVFVGSMNLDPRSANLNTEMGVLVESPELAEQLRGQFERTTGPEISYRVVLEERRRARLVRPGGGQRSPARARAGRERRAAPRRDAAAGSCRSTRSCEGRSRVSAGMIRRTARTPHDHARQPDLVSPSRPPAPPPAPAAPQLQVVPVGQPGRRAAADRAVHAVHAVVELLGGRARRRAAEVLQARLGLQDLGRRARDVRRGRRGAADLGLQRARRRGGEQLHGGGRPAGAPALLPSTAACRRTASARPTTSSTASRSWARRRSSSRPHRLASYHRAVIDTAKPLDRYSAPQWLGERASRRFHVMVKPAGSTCNLDCTYCFYLEQGDAPGGPGGGRHGRRDAGAVRAATTSRASRRTRSSSRGRAASRRCSGSDFFQQSGRTAEEICEAGPADRERPADQRHAARRGLGAVPQGAPVPGRPEHRRPARASTTATGSRRTATPTFDKVLPRPQLLQKHGVPFNTLTCVQPLQRHAAARRLSLPAPRTGLDLPAVHPDRRERRTSRPAAPQTLGSAATAGRRRARGSAGSPGLHRHATGRWIPTSTVTSCRKVFDEWLRSRLRQGAGQPLRNAGGAAHGHAGPRSACYGEFCGKGVALEHDGSVYACDHYVYPEYRLGNLREKSLGDMVFSPGAGEIRLREIRDAAGVMPRVPVSSATAGANVPGTGCCARPTASPGSITCVRA